MHCVANLALPLIFLSAPVDGSRADGMVFPGNEWELTTPESQHVDSRKLEAAIGYLAESGGSGGVSIHSPAPPTSTIAMPRTRSFRRSGAS